MWNLVKQNLGCFGGVIIYFAGKWLTRLVNLHRVEQRLSPEIISRFSVLFPRLDLREIRIKDHANLLPNRMPFLTNAAGMTFNHRVYFLHTYNENDPRFLRLLVHELVHTEQVRRLGGEVRFACAYGKGYLQGGGYDANPLEIEADEFAKSADIY